MKTVSQLAAETGVSVQKIYRLLNSVKQIPESDKQFPENNLTEKINGTLHITGFGEAEIKSRLTSVKQNFNTVKQVLNNVKHPETDELQYLREQNKAL